MEIPNYVNLILERFTAAGYHAYPVGGCVRDALLGLTPDDWDVTADAPPERTLELFGAAAHPTGLQHGTVTVVSEGRAVEVTTMRRDGAYRDNRHPESVTFTDRVEDDLARRDFTVNAMALAPDGGIVDPFGGQDDLRAGVLRCVGDARQRFDEDALRILRLLRFASRLGFIVEPSTSDAAREKRELLRTVAAERVYAELNKLLCGGHVARTLLDFPDVLGVVMPEILPCAGFEQHSPHHCFDVWGHTARSVGAAPPRRELRWTMLFHDLGKPQCFTVDERGVGHFYGHTAISCELAEGIMARLRFEKALSAKVRAQLACFDDAFPPERAALHREMARRGKDVVSDLLLTKLADNAAKSPEGLERAQKPWLAAREVFDLLVAEGACCELADLAVNGGDMAAVGFRGRAIGAALRKLLCEVAEERLPNEKPALLRRAERLYGSGYGAEVTKNRGEA
ncbi:MAG: CCA tRNA nucleotidyltransferase [Oscillospiraceae bacterium]|nr:CCA tRNA nucleotidyltransferase [Oscillospiraceae bacterium]